MNKCLIIAEIGLNHNGQLNLAIDSVKAAADAGADAVKFQNFITEDFLTDKAITYTYKTQGVEVTESFFELCKRNEFKREWIKPISNLCEELGVIFMSTPTSFSGVDDLLEAGCKYVKNGSDYITHIPLLRHMAKSGMHVILSTGMSDVQDVDEAMNALTMAEGGVTVLQCTSSYPTDASNVNLRRMLSLRDRYGCDVGFSDHTIGYMASVQAVSMGAKIIEKHFTLDHNLPGPDHWFSVNPEELKELVQEIRMAELRLGFSEIKSTASEDGWKNENRIGVVAARDILVGELLTEDDILYKKPLLSIKPADIEKYLGMPLKKPIKKYAPIRYEDFLI